MDTTETYIKMCEKAEEIQEHQPRMGLVPPTNEDTFIGLFACYWAGDFDWVKQKSRYIWLPRQDQLQEMAWTIGAGYSKPHYLLKDFAEFASPYWNYTIQFTSMEQLWLAFVMKEKFGKVWSNGEWVKN